MTPVNVVVLASGTGSNFAALADAAAGEGSNFRVVGLFCDQPAASAVAEAAKRHISVTCFSPQIFPSKYAYEMAILAFLRSVDAQVVVLAGYMRLVGQTLLEAYPDRIVNIHPSLLPDYAGLDAIGRAYRDGAPKTGVTIHVVDSGMDTGPALAQEAIEIDPEWTEEDLTREVHKVEHRLYPQVLNQLAAQFPTERPH